MHWVKITQNWEGALPPHSWATRWVIFNPTLLSALISGMAGILSVTQMLAIPTVNNELY